MRTTVRRRGNSFIIPVPMTIARTVHLHQGMIVDFETTGGVLTVRPTRRRRRRSTLTRLLAQMKPRHRHGELHNATRRGRELL